MKCFTLIYAKKGNNPVYEVFAMQEDVPEIWIPSILLTSAS